MSYLHTLLNDFVVLVPRDVGALTCAIVSREKNRWILLEDSYKDYSLLELRNLAKTHKTAIVMNIENRRWFKEKWIFENQEYLCPFFKTKDWIFTPYLMHFQCFVHIINKCFYPFAEYIYAKAEYEENLGKVTPIQKYFLNVPYKEKNNAKELGARWQGTERRQWYIPIEDDSIQDITPFLKWVHPDDQDFLVNIYERRKEFVQKNKRQIIGQEIDVFDQLDKALKEFQSTINKD